MKRSRDEGENTSTAAAAATEIQLIPGGPLRARSSTAGRGNGVFATRPLRAGWTWLDHPVCVEARSDTGAHATCTDQLSHLHNCTKFDQQHPCPVTSMPATDGSDAIPHGHGCLHVPCGHGDCASMKCFCHPVLYTTVIDEHGIIKSFGTKPKDIKSDCTEKFHDHSSFNLQGNTPQIDKQECVF